MPASLMLVAFQSDEAELRHILGIEVVYDRDAPPSQISRDGIERLKICLPNLAAVYW